MPEFKSLQYMVDSLNGSELVYSRDWWPNIESSHNVILGIIKSHYNITEKIELVDQGTALQLRANKTALSSVVIYYRSSVITVACGD